MDVVWTRSLLYNQQASVWLYMDGANEACIDNNAEVSNLDNLTNRKQTIKQAWGGKVQFLNMLLLTYQLYTKVIIFKTESIHILRKKSYMIILFSYLCHPQPPSEFEVIYNENHKERSHEAKEIKNKDRENVHSQMSCIIRIKCRPWRWGFEHHWHIG